MRGKFSGVLVIVAALINACQPGPVVRASANNADILIASDLPGAVEDQNAPALQWAIQLAIQEHPRIGRYTLGYLPLDDSVAGMGFPQKGRQNVERMVADAPVLGMIGPFNSAVAFDEIPVANAAGLVMLSPSNTNPCLTLAVLICNPQLATLRPSGTNNYFRTAPPDPVEGRAMARFAVDSLHVRRAAAFDENPRERLIVDSFAAELARTGNSLVLREDLQEGTTSFIDFLKRAQERGAQAIYAATTGDHACQARAQMQTILAAGSYFLGIDGIVESGSDCVSDAGSNAEGMYATIGDLDPTHSSDPAVQKLVASYRARFPNTTPPPYTFAAYDCALVLIDAITRAMEANHGIIPRRSQVLDAIAHADFSGVTDHYSFDSAGDVISPLMSLYQVQNGRWLYVKQIDASSR